MDISVTVETHLAREMERMGSAIREGADEAVTETTASAKFRAREMVSAALSRRAGNTVTDKYYPKQDKPIVGWLYSRWWNRSENVLAAFAYGATVRPRAATALAIPLKDSGTSWWDSGQFTDGRMAQRRVTPRIFERVTGQKLFRIRSRAGHTLLAIRRPDAKGLKRGSGTGRRLVKSNRAGYRGRLESQIAPIFLLVKQSQIPKRFEFSVIREFAEQRLPLLFFLSLGRRKVFG
ncbi:MAG: hypothetical protein K0R61_1182 [Microvirga sp.]|jgi:hypothetical protein|nr:hypothetical protein [Microvirga sp.]MDF2970732.1 hypothetical protein [Microvirga sp.]